MNEKQVDVVFACLIFQEARRVFEQGVGRVRAELTGDKEAALSAFRRASEDEMQVGLRRLQCLCFIAAVR